MSIAILADIHSNIEALQRGLRNALCEILRPVEKPLTIEKPDGPYVILMVGVNGAGKTTTIRMLCGIMRPSSGSGTVLGFDIVKERRIQ